MSSIFYAWGRLEGYLPTRAVLAMVWERTLQLSLNFDCQGMVLTHMLLTAFGYHLLCVKLL